MYDGEASFRHLSQFPGRIMLLEIAHSGENEQYFFWMQDSQKDDENFVVIVNELIGECTSRADAGRRCGLLHNPTYANHINIPRGEGRRRVNTGWMDGECMDGWGDG